MSGGVSIQQYIDSLDYDQLCNLIDKANKKKRQKDGESKVWVHQVTSHLLCKNFRCDDILGAATHISESVLKIAKSDDDIGEKVYKISQVGLNSFKEVKSEYDSWFD